jgi:hypothetical protein
MNGSGHTEESSNKCLRTSEHADWKKAYKLQVNIVFRRFKSSGI